MEPVKHSSPPPLARVVLLGASNLRLGLPIVVQLAMTKLGSPLEFYVAHGFGRSYGAWSSIPGRALPGIAQCELWTDLHHSPSLPTFAMLTDVGNDLLYGRTPQQVSAWVGACVERLARVDAHLVITELPISSILATSSLHYKIFRTIFFPPSRLPIDEACMRARETNNHLRGLADKHGCVAVAMQKEWYGIDPIHLRRRFRKAAWSTAIDTWPTPSTGPTPRILSLKNRLFVELATAQQQRLLGRDVLRAQPCVVFDDGSTLSVY